MKNTVRNGVNKQNKHMHTKLSKKYNNGKGYLVQTMIPKTDVRRFAVKHLL